MNHKSPIYATLAYVCMLVVIVTSSLSMAVPEPWLIVSLVLMFVFAVCIYLSIHRHEYNEV